jgi:hypothetical protein
VVDTEVLNMQQMSNVLALPMGTQALLETPVKTDRVIWFAVAIYLLIALGGSIIIGALVWCFMHATHELHALFQINPWVFSVGCS